jgi:hypothetical protein
MSTSNFVKTKAPRMASSMSLPANFLNAYEVVNKQELSWPVSVYAIDLTEEGERQEQRSQIKNVMWELKKQHRATCRGYGFVIDISPRLVVVPQSWQIPTPIKNGRYTVSLDQSFVARADNETHGQIVAGILREAIKAHFKNNQSEDLGDLWQNYNSFCQYPSHFGDEYLTCRRFTYGPKVLRGGRWVIRLSVSTLTLDGRTFKDYYDEGNVDLLAERLETKRGERLNRDNRPAAVHVLHQANADHSLFKCLDLEDFDLILHQGTLPHSDQRAQASGAVRCKSFAGPSFDVPLGELRLFLSSEITQEDHAETLIGPGERFELTDRLRAFVNGADVFGQRLQLSDVPIDADSLDGCVVLPPAVRLKGSNGGVEILAPPSAATEEELRNRAQKRMHAIRKNGFLKQRPINPLLAWPARMGDSSGRRMKADLEFISESQGLPIGFELLLYRDIEEIARSVDKGAYDAVLAVLPESSRDGFNHDNTHEKIKRRLEVPSQCLLYEHTLPKKWVDKPVHEFKERDARMAKRVRNTYDLCLLNLLVKHHWFPFAPASAFNYNVHVGLDVGGVHNTHAMACLGYGFRRPNDLLLFRPEEIPIEFQKKEPIPTDSLFRGLSGLFDLVASQLRSNGVRPDFETVLFIRDGKLLGDGDKWNERDALERLYTDYLKRGLISEKATWTAVEIMKGAEGWRVFRNDLSVTNPLVGKCVFPFDDDKTGLICTTGAPYLTQGTACPLLAHILDIRGESNRNAVMQDLIWESDLCFTKPDMGMSLPWVLNVADTGALQLSRSYNISGITA